MKRIVPLMVGAVLCGLFVFIALRRDVSVSSKGKIAEAAKDSVIAPLSASEHDRPSAPEFQKELASAAFHTTTVTGVSSTPSLSTPVPIVPPAASSSPVFRRLQPIRILAAQRTESPSAKEVTYQQFVETGGKYPHVILDQKFHPGPDGTISNLKSEVAYAADTVLLRTQDAASLERLVTEGEIHSYRKITRNIYRVRLVRPTLNAVAEAKKRLVTRIPGATEIEPDYLVFTAQEPQRTSQVDRNGDGVIDEELPGSMSVDMAGDTVATLSPELIAADAEQRLANMPMGSRVLTFDRPLSDARPEVGYRPYFMEQNFLLLAAPGEYATIYPQPPYNSGYPSNGTIYVRSLRGDAGMQIRHKDGLPFSIYQIDLSEYSTVYSANAVTFVGYREDGTSVTQSFTLDKQMDGTGPLQDFQTFSFGPGFSNLDRVVITSEGFMMDNLVVAPSGEETPLPPPPAPPTLYDITWDGFPHQLDQVTAVTGPYAPSTLNFGAPRVKSQIGPMAGPALELRGTGSTYEQFSCLVDQGGNSYTTEFDMTMPSGGSLVLVFDRTANISRIDFNSNGSISSTFGFSGTFPPAIVTRFRFEIDLVNASCKVFKNGSVMYSGSFPGRTQMGDIEGVRFSASVSDTQAIGIDNLHISGDIPGNTVPSGPRALITPPSVAFPTTTSGMSVTRSVLVENIGSQPLSISNIRTDSSQFKTDTKASLTLLPGQGQTIAVTYSPTEPGSHLGKLTFTANESSDNTKTVSLAGTATGIPVVNLTPTTLHVTMLADDVGTEYFNIHNTGTDTLQWSFITAPPASPVTPTIPNDAQFTALWGMQSPTANAGGIDASRAWSITTDSSRVRVGVIDTGVDYMHQDLAANIVINTLEIPGNGIDDDKNGYIDDVHGWNFYANSADPMDDNGHGTHVSGTIGASGNNNTGVSGVAWKAAIVPLKFLGPQGFGYTSDAIEAVDYAATLGCRVINASWGGGGYSTLLRDSIEEFTVANGALFVAAAGNSFQNNDVQPSFPAAYDVSGIVTVAASDSFDKLASFSNWGTSSVDIAAPGVGILSCAPGGKYMVSSGTSMAAPHVSGSIALLFSYHPTLSHVECQQRLISNADHPPALADKVRLGSRLNVYAALSSSVAPWIQPGVWSGSVPAPGTFKVPLSVDTHGLEPGEYTTSLALQTNDPAQPQVQIPVHLKVLKRHRFNEWSTQQFSVNNLLFDANAANTWAASADPDNDGSSNLMEFLTGSDPARASALPLEGIADPELGRCFRFQTRNDLGGVKYHIEWTDNLTSGTWQSTGIQTRLIHSDPTRQIDLWDAYLPDSDDKPSIFFRIVASEQ